MGKAATPLATRGRFSQRLSAIIGGNEHSGPFHSFPFGHASLAYNGFYEYFNDFDRVSDFDVSTFEWNRTDGSASAYGAGTAIARVPEWIVASIGSVGTVTLAPSLTSALIKTDSSYGILRVDAGSTDATGTQVTKAPTGSNLASGVTLAVQPTTYGNASATLTPHRRLVIGARFTVNETGTATQSASYVAWSRDDNALLTTAGAVTGNGNFGFFKAVGSNSIQFTSRVTATGTPVTVATLTPGTMVNVSAVINKRGPGSTDFKADLYANNVYVASYSSATTTNSPTDDNYAPAMAIVNGTGADCTLDVDNIWCLSERV